MINRGKSILGGSGVQEIARTRAKYLNQLRIASFSPGSMAGIVHNARGRLVEGFTKNVFHWSKRKLRKTEFKVLLKSKRKPNGQRTHHGTGFGTLHGALQSKETARWMR